MKIILLEVVPEKHTLTMKLVPPLGLGYIASSLETKGYTVKLIEGIVYEGLIKKAFEMAIAERPDIIGFTATSQARFRTVELIKKLKNKTGALTVAGGPHFNATAKEALEHIPELDVVVKGEGELTFAELVETYEKKEVFSKVKGIWFRYKGEPVETIDRPACMELDVLPSPAYHLFSHNRYTCTLDGTKLKAIGVVSSRGCPNNCIFCANRVLRKSRLRLRNPVKFVDEIEALIKGYGYKAFDFWDDTLTMSRSHVHNICNEIISRGLKMQWFARARVNTVDAETLKLMKRAGCVSIAYGVESGSDKILRVVNKGTTVAQAEEAVKVSSEVGLRVNNYFIVSLPQETFSDIRDTLSLMNKFERYRNVHNYYCFAMIYPGTDIEIVARQEGLVLNDFHWYKPFYYLRNKIVGNDPTIPCYETKEMSLEAIKSYILKSKTPLQNIRIAMKRMIRIDSFSELKKLIYFVRSFIAHKLGVSN